MFVRLDVADTLSRDGTAHGDQGAGQHAESGTCQVRIEEMEEERQGEFVETADLRALKVFV